MSVQNQEMTEDPSLSSTSLPSESSSTASSVPNPIYRTLRTEYGNTTKFHACKVCKPLSAKPMYHYHHSTKFMYNTMLARKEEQVHCPTCKEVQPINQEEEKGCYVHQSMFGTSTTDRNLLCHMAGSTRITGRRSRRSTR